MKQANNIELVVWLIVAVVVTVAKGLGKLATPSTSDDDAAPVATPKPPVRRPPPRRPGPRPVVAAPPARRVVVTAPQPAPPVMEPPVAEVEAPAQPKAEPPPPPAPSRASQWAVALRDRSNIRNVIIANEIIGPPVALRN